MPSNTDDGIVAVARAWNDEWPRWISRDARWLKLGFQVCREDGSGCAGEFSEVHRFETGHEMDEGLERLRDAACARAAIAAYESHLRDKGMVVLDVKERDLVRQ